MDFVKLNMNPGEKKAGDCVVRAISCATGKSWEEVYKDLCALGLEEYDMPNSRKVFYKYLDKLGWKKQPMPRQVDIDTGQRKRYTIKDFVDVMDKKKTLIVSVAQHLTCVEDGALVDTWNCGYKSMGNYWVKD